jgi:hypothetical protein
VVYLFVVFFQAIVLDKVVEALDRFALNQDRFALNQDDKITRLATTVDRFALNQDDKITRLATTVEDALSIQKTIAFSKMTNEHLQSMMEGQYVDYGSGTLSESMPDGFSHYAHFQWSDKKEDNQEQRTNYMRHIREQFVISEDLAFEDVKGYAELLDNWVSNVDVRGTTDVILLKKADARIGAERNQMHCLFEWKKPQALVDNTRDCRRQVQAKFLSAALLSHSIPVVGVLSDLQDFWQLFWLSSDRHVRSFKCESGTEAKFALERLFRDGVDLLNRVAFDDLQESKKQRALSVATAPSSSTGKDAVPVDAMQVCKFLEGRGEFVDTRLAQLDGTFHNDMSIMREVTQILTQHRTFVY